MRDVRPTNLTYPINNRVIMNTHIKAEWGRLKWIKNTLKSGEPFERKGSYIIT